MRFRMFTPEMGAYFRALKIDKSASLRSSLSTARIERIKHNIKHFQQDPNGRFVAADTDTFWTRLISRACYS